MKQRIILTASVAIELDTADSEEGSVEWNMNISKVVTPINSSIRQALENSIAHIANAEYTGSISYTYVDSESNLHRCIKCKRLFTDRELDDQIPGLPIGRTYKNEKYCSECEMFNYYSRA